MPDGGANFFAGVIADKLQPKPELTVTQWADAHRQLPKKSSAEFGQWVTARMPFLAEIQDCLSVHHPAHEVVFMKPTQVGGTEAGLNWVGYTVDYDPGPMMIVWPTTSLGLRNVRTRLDPMIRATPALRQKIAPERSRDATNTASMKDFEDGVLVIAGANSASDLSSQSVAKLLLDEVDKYPADLDDEGDPVDQAERGVSSFWRHKIFKLSSPTVASLSRIFKDWKKSDQRLFHVPCPHCDTMQVLAWDHLRWPEGKPHLADYECPHCAAVIPERFKDGMLAAGRWVGTYPGWQLIDGLWRLPEGGREVPGFNINALYTPTGLGRNWGQHAARWLERKQDPIRLKVWTHQTLGVPFEDADEKLEWEEIKQRAEPYALRQIPQGCLILTCGVDVQKDRVEYTVRGAGAEGRRWTIDNGFLPGDPLRSDVWDALDAYLAQPFVNGFGVPLRLWATFVDAGNWQNEVLAFTTPRRGRNIFAVKGGPGYIGNPVLRRPSRVDFKRNGVVEKRGAELYLIGVGTVKQAIYTRLAADRKHPPEHRQEHFSHGLADDFYIQLTAEVLDPNKRLYVKLKDRRNEGLDTTVYAEAAMYHPVVSIQRKRPADWENLARLLEPATPDLFAQTVQTFAPTPSPAPAPAADGFLADGRHDLNNWIRP